MARLRNGKLKVTGNGILVTDALSLSPAANGFAGGILDLADNDLIVHGGSLTTIQSLLANGYNGGAWNDLSDFGSGAAPAAIDSATAAADDNGIEALGYAEVGQPNSPTAGLFDGQPVVYGDIVVRFTYYGDANLDGVVNSTDETAMENGETNNLTGWNNGDFDYSGVVDDNDAALLDASESFDLAAPLPPAAENQLYSFTLPGDAIEANTEISTIQNWQVRWGDGFFDNYTVPAGGSPDVLASHTYATPNVGGYAVSIIASGTGGYGSRSHIYTLVLPHEDVVVAPDAPTDLSATESTAGELDLTWADDRALATGYIVTATPTTGGTTITQNYNSSTLAASVTGLTADVSYTFSVVADNTLSDGISAQSAPVTLATVPLVVPVGLTATATAPNEIDLSWASGAAPGTGFNIFISTDGTTFNYFDSTSGDQTTYQALGLAPNQTYTFAIQNAYSPHDQSTPSDQASATTPVDPWNVQATGASTAVEGSEYQLSLSASPSSSGPAFDHLTVDWGDGSAPDSYSSEMVTASHIFATGIDSSAIDVTASTADGATPALTVTTEPIEVDLVPAAPTDLQAVAASPTEIDLSWTNNSQDADGYSVFRSLDDGNFQPIAELGGTANSYSDMDLTANTTASYMVQATESSTAAVSTSATAPAVTTPVNAVTPAGQPTLSVAQYGIGHAIVSWTYQGSNDTGFELEEMDQNIDQNFHLIQTPGPVGATGSGSTIIATPDSGDEYYFRIRADHVGGTASHYVGVGISGAGILAPAATAISYTLPGPYNNILNELLITITDADATAAAANGATVTYTAEMRPSDGLIWESTTIGAFSNAPWDFQSFGDPGVTYEYRGRVSVNGVISAWSPSAEATVPVNPQYLPPPPPPTVASPSIGETVNQDTSVSVSWTNEGQGVSYEFALQATNDVGNGNEYWFTNLTMPNFTTPAGTCTSGVQYYIQVRAFGALASVDGNGNPVSIPVIGYAAAIVILGAQQESPPAAPAGLRAVNLGDGVTNNKVELIWENIPDNEDGYLIERSTDSSFVGNLTQFTVSADVTNFIDSVGAPRPAPAQSVTYHYRVAAYRGNALSGFIDVTDTPWRSPVAMAISWIPLNSSYAPFALTSNPSPPSQFDPIGPNSLSEYEDEDEYRDILTVQVGLSVDPYSGQISSVSPIVQQQGGYTPLPVYPDGSRFYLGGKASNGIDSTVFNSDHTQVTVTVTARFRINLLENIGFFALNLHGIAWAWARISYTINTGGGASAAYSGSIVPSQTDYWDDVSVGGYSMSTDPDDIDSFLNAASGSLGPPDNR